MKKTRKAGTPYIRAFIYLSVISAVMFLFAFLSYTHGTSAWISEGDLGTRIIPAMPPKNHVAITLFIYSFIIETIGIILLLIGINKNRPNL